MQYRVTITAIQKPGDAPVPEDRTLIAMPTESTIFTQTVDDLNVAKFVRGLNAMPRRRKSKTGAGTQP